MTRSLTTVPKTLDMRALVLAMQRHRVGCAIIAQLINVSRHLGCRRRRLRTGIGEVVSIPNIKPLHGDNELVGPGKAHCAIARMVLLKPRDDTDDCEQALFRNTILVAQPSPEMIAIELPPSETEQAQHFNVIYAAGGAEHGPSNLRNKERPARESRLICGVRATMDRAVPARRGLAH